MADAYEDKVIFGPYEISIWDDIYDTDMHRFTEEKVAVIGSDTMTAQTRAIDPVLIENINGTKTLTFSIYYRYIDNFDGIEKINPFIKLLIAERKIKLHWKNEWYDFIIKNKVESSDKHSFYYTCESLAANELTKTGYHIEFDTELVNNTDTIWNLASTVIEGTDWRLANQSGKNFRETVEEPGYKVSLSNSATIDGKNEILVFYNTIFNVQSQTEVLSGRCMVQVWVGDLESADSNGTLQNGFCITDGNGNFLKYTENNEQKIEFSFQYDNYDYVFVYNVTNQGLYTGLYNYRAKRDILQQLTVFSPPLNRYVSQYTRSDNGDLVYGYTTAQYVAPEVVTNLIINNKDFSNTDGWFNAGFFTIYPTYDADSDFNVLNYHPISYLLTNEKYLGNNAFLHNTNYIPDGLVKGDKLIVRIKIKKASYNNATNIYNITDLNGSTLSVKAFITTYTYNSQTHKYTPNTSSDYGNINLTFNNGYMTGELAISSSLSRTDLLTQRVGIFFDITRPVLSTNEYYAIEDAELYFKKTNVDGTIITPNSVDETSVITYISKYYDPSQNSANVKEEDITWLYIGTSHLNEQESKWPIASPILDETCEKIRTIAGKNSTRYNWLQTLAETFEVWCKFWVEHEDDGRIKYDLIDGKWIPRKFVTFEERIGNQIDYGFIYGIDLKAIQRNIDSTSIATKIIVPQNSNQFAPNGSCTIQRSEENYSKENYILNFDYYCDNGLIDRGRLQADLYEPKNDEIGNIGYYQELHRLNNTYDATAEEILALKNDLDLQQGYLDVYQNLLSATHNEISSIEAQITGLISSDHTGASTGYSAANVTEFLKNNNNAKWQRVIDLYTTREELLRNATSYASLIESLEESIATINDTLYDEEEGLIHLQELNLEERQAIVDQFNQRYSRYVQEGTWQSEDYTDHTKYYLDGQAVAYTAARPKLTYNISVIRVSALEPFKNKIFRLGDISWVEDEEFFMARYREEVVITQVTQHLDMPENDSITVQNYRTQFQDLFQRTESTIQSFQYGEGSYNRAASIVEPDGTINVATLENSIAANNYLMSQSSLNNAITTGVDGITVTDVNDVGHKVRITANGIFITTDGGNNWVNAIKGTGVSTEALSAGVISTKDILIDGGQGNTFRWDERGISAYYFDNQNEIIDTSHYLRLDRFGVYGILNNADFVPSAESDVFDEASFGMTWNRFFMKNKYGTHYIEVSSTNDIRVVDTTGATEVEQIKIGQLVAPIIVDDQVQTPGVYGIRISDGSGTPVMETTNDGSLWLQDVLHVGTTSQGNYRVDIGYLPIVNTPANQITWGSTNLDTRAISSGSSSYIHRTIDVNNKFVVWEDGTIYAKDGYFEGAINATSGQIGGVSIDAIAALPSQMQNLASFEITSQSGNTFVVENSAATPSSITLEAVAHGFTITSVTWSYTTDLEGSWTTISGETSATLEIDYANDFPSSSDILYLRAIASGHTAYFTINKVDLDISVDSTIYNTDLNTDTIYRIYESNGSISISQSNYTFSLFQQDGTVLTPNTDYIIQIALLPSLVVNNPESIQEQIQTNGYSDLITALNTKVVNPGNIFNYDAVINKTYTFNLSGLMTAEATTGNEEEIEALEAILQLQNVVFLVKFVKNNQQIAQLLLHLNTWVSENIAQFNDTATKILQAQANASYEFTNTGLIINNGNFIIRKQLWDVEEEHTADSSGVFALDNMPYGNIRIYDKLTGDEVTDFVTTQVTEPSTGITYIQVTVADGANTTFVVDYQIDDNKDFLYFDPDSQNFVFNGTIYANDGVFGGELNAATGTFSGTLAAATGNFSGSVTAQEGNIGGFIIGPHSISSDNLILQSAYSINDETYPSKISVQNIDIGSGASITEYIQLGETARLYGDNSNILLLAGTDANLDTNAKIIINKDGTMSLGTLRFDGVNSTISSGTNWSITPITATFNDIIASGKIVSSIFEYDKLQVVGGQMLFRPIYEITDVTFQDNTTYSYSFNSSETIPNNSVVKLYMNISNLNADIGGVSGFVTSSNGAYQVEVANELTNPEDYKYLLHLGEVTINENATENENPYSFNNSLILGINSTNNGSLLLPKGLTIREPASYTPNSFELTYDNNPRIYLGDLTQIPGINLANSGYKYGLYSDNVVLSGSLTTKIVGNFQQGQDFYAGINTNGPVESSMLDGDKNLVVIWAGAIDTTADAISHAPFQVTQDGSIYANKGIFEGSILTRAYIEAAEMYTPKLYGGTKDNLAALRIYSTASQNGISFIDNSQLDSDNQPIEITTLNISSDGFYSHTQTEPFIALDNTGIATFNGKVNATEIKLGNFSVSGDIFTNDDTSTLTINTTLLQYIGTNTSLIINKDHADINSNTVKFTKDIMLGDNIMTYKQVTGIIDSVTTIIGYDLYVKEGV